MGFVFHGVPLNSATWGIEQPQGATAIETGTLHGDSALVLAEAFGLCHTIETDPNLASRAATRFKNDRRITVVEESSRDSFNACLRRRENPPFIWLDAHWSRNLGTEADDPCPLLSEIEVIGRVFGDRALVLVDDARVFGAIAPRDNVRHAWPSLQEVLSELEGIGLAALLLDDVAAGVPPRLNAFFPQLSDESWTSKAGTVDVFVASLNRMRGGLASKWRSTGRSTKAGREGTSRSRSRLVSVTV